MTDKNKDAKKEANNKPSSPETAKPKKEKTLSQMIEETPFNVNNKVGQAFVMGWNKKPSNAPETT